MPDWRTGRSDTRRRAYGAHGQPELAIDPISRATLRAVSGRSSRMPTTAQELSRAYLRREPESGVLYEVLASHLETFLAHGAGDGVAPSLPRYEVDELRDYLRCGILAHGFARLHCFRCGTDRLVAFSCKGRGFCPSCGGRRMAESAAHLTDHVIPRVPVRQWVVSFPWVVRYLLARRPALCGAVRRLFLRAVFGFYRARAAKEGIAGGRSGAVNRVQRFGSSVNLYDPS